MSTDRVDETLRVEIAELESEIEHARNELYGFGTSYGVCATLCSQHVIHEVGEHSIDGRPVAGLEG